VTASITISSVTATPAVVTGSNTVLSVTASENGSSAGLTYRWSEASGPCASIQPSTASIASAIFHAAGTYSFKIVVKDGHGRSASATVSVIVAQTMSTLTVSPATATVAINLTRSFRSVVRDQFNAVDHTAVTWAVTSGVGSIAQAGIFSAGPVPGSAIVEATVSGLAATASITVRDGPPAVTSTTISAAPVTTSIASVTVIATDAAGTSGLTISGPAARPR